MFLPKITDADFIVWERFFGIIDSCLVMLVYMHNLCGAWFMFCVIVSGFDDFLIE